VFSPFFWKKLISVCRRVDEDLRDNPDECVIHAISINFGNWDTRVFEDHYAEDCHAHAHVLLSPVAIKNAAKYSALQSIRDYSALNGRTYPYDDYVFKDSNALETEVLLSLESQRSLKFHEDVKKEVSFVKEEMSILKQDVSTLKEDVRGLKQDVSGLKQDVSGLKQDVSGMKQDVSELKQGMQQVLAFMKTMSEKK
jgi:hypothetical protein